MAFVYIIQDEISQRYYTGSCLDLEKRIKRHKQNTACVTTSKWNASLVCFKEFESIEEARKIEKLIKSYKGGNSFRKILNEWRRG